LRPRPFPIAAPSVPDCGPEIPEIGFLRLGIPKDIGCVWEGRDWGGGCVCVICLPIPFYRTDVCGVTSGSSSIWLKGEVGRKDWGSSPA